MDPRAQSAFVDDLLTHVGWVQALAHSLVRDSATADDLAQETWVAALTGRRATNESPRGWLARVLRNRLLQRVRSEKTRADHETVAGRDPDFPSSDDWLERIEQQKLLAEALVSLREPFRESVILRYYEGLNATEIGERLGESSAAIRQRLKRGLEALREDLDRRVEGGREAWLSALLPLAELGRSGSIPVDPLGAGAGSALIGVLTVKKLAIAVVALVLVGSAAFWWQEPSLATSSLSPGDAELVLAPPADDRPEARDEVALSPATTATAAQRTAVESEGTPPGRPSLTGRIAPPEHSAGIDETLEVFALSEPLDYAAFLSAEDSGAKQHLLAKTRLQPDGEFEFRFEDEPERVFLMVRGRHLYLEESLEVALGGTPMVVLTPVCGAWIQGRVLLPPSARNERSTHLADARVRLFTDQIFGVESGTPEQYLAEVDGSGRFELRAIAGNRGAKLFATATSLAARLVPLDEFDTCAELAVDIELFSGGSVAGRVATEDGASVANARVRAILPGDYLGFDDHRVGEALTDERGRFTLEHLPLGEVFLAAFRDGYLDSEKLSLTVRDREQLEGAALVLPTGNAIAGRAVYEDGRPAVGATIEVEFDRSYQVGLSAFNALRGARGRAVTDAEGAFRVTGLGAGPFVVKVDVAAAELTRSARRDAVQANTQGLELVLRAPLELRGTVLAESGQAVDEFRVRAVRVVDGAIGETATVKLSREFEAAQGAFALEGLIAGRWRVDVSAAGFASSESRVVELPTADAVTFVLSSPASIEGLVLDPEGEPLADATVALETGRSKWQAQFADASDSPSATSDERGRFTLTGVRAGEVSVRAAAEGYARSPAVALSVAAGQMQSAVTLQLTRGGHITGEILEQGKPAAGRVITLVQWQRGEFDTSLAESDDAGRFEFENVEPGLWTVVAMDLKADWSSTDKGDSMTQRMGSMKSAQVEVKEGSSDHVVLGALPKLPIRLTGRVLRSDEPYVGAMVIVHSLEADSESEAKTTAVDENGDYQLVVDGPGSYQLSVNRMGRSAGEMSAFTFVVELEDVPESVIDIEIPSGGLAGVVVDKDGEPVPGVGITLVPAANASPSKGFARRFLLTSTDESGRFELADLEAGSYLLTTAPKNGLAGVRLPGLELGRDQWKRDLELRLPRSGAVDLRVSDELGRLCPKAAIFARDSSGTIVDRVSPVKTDDEGRARYEGLAPGSYSFFARSAEFVSGVEVEVRVESGGSSEVELAVQLGAHLIVTAKADRESVPASFALVDEAGHEVANLFSSPIEAQQFWREGLSGQRRIGPLPAGSYRVTATTSSGESATIRVTLEVGEERKLTVRL